MRSFSVAGAAPGPGPSRRALLTAAGIVLGVGMILGVLLLAATINRTFADLYDSVYGRGRPGRLRPGETRCHPRRFARPRDRRR